MNGVSASMFGGIVPARRNIFRGFAPLRHRQFALFWSGALVSNIGNWMETVTAGILVTEATGKAEWTGLVAVAGFLPSVVLGPLGGALADRFPRKLLLLVSNALQMVLAAMLAVVAATGPSNPLTIALILFASGCASSVSLPAFQTMLPDLVPQEDLLGAIALSSAQWNLGRVIGPAMAGVVIAAGGYKWAFICNSLSFLAVIGAVLALTLPRPAKKLRRHLLAEIADGARFAARDTGVRSAITTIALCSLLAGPFIALVPVMAIKVLHAGSRGAATLVTGQGIGAVSVAFFVLGPLAHRIGRHRVLIATLFLLPPALICYALSPGLWVAFPAIMVLGGLYLSLLSGLTTVVQLRVPQAIRGRVLSLHMATLSLLFPIGSVVQGTVADQVGLRVTTVSAALLLAAVLLVSTAVRPMYLRSLRAEPSEVDPASQVTPLRHGPAAPLRPTVPGSGTGDG
jgi:MFS family permease